MSEQRFAPNRLVVTLASDARFLPLVRAIAREGAEMAGFDAEERHRIVLAVTEAVTNVIRHVYEGAPDRRIDLVLRPANDAFRLEIVDYGTYVDPERIASRPLDQVRPGGLGVHLIKSTMDRAEYRENAHGGTTLVLVRNAAAAKETR